MIKEIVPKVITKQMPRPKHLPQRTCIACRQVKAKRELIRLIRTTAGVEVDPTGKKAGRGSYLCQERGCWERGLKGNQLEQALRTKITKEERLKLLEYGKEFPKEGG